MTARLRAVPALLAVVSALALPAAASAADYLVTTEADGSDGVCNSQCTLREAIATAGPTDRVVVPARPYTLSDGPIVLDGVTIVGAGARTTVIDAGNGAIFTVSTGANQVSGVTLTGGDGLHELQGARIGGAVDVAGPASLTMTGTTIRGNTAWLGGGVAVRTGGTLRLVRSTVSGNTSTGVSGSHGGGIYLDGGIVTLENVTVSGNTATDTPTTAGNADGGGIYVGETGTLTTRNVTLANNRAVGEDGLFLEPGSDATVTLNNTIVASGPNRNSCAGNPSLFTGDHNLSDDASCGFSEPTDKRVDPQLGPLTNNGGPTDTHALPAGSAAVNAGAGCPATDQRGAARAGACDIGAFEYVPPGASPSRPPQPPPPPPPAGDQSLPPPVAGESVNVQLKRGTVRVRLSGRKRFSRLTAGQQVPVGTTLDTRKGRVTLTAAANRTGGTATADFYGGIFKLGQTKGAKPVTTLALTEKLACPRRGKATTAAKRKKKRRLWGNGRGRFRTKGEYSSATVRGTKWLVQDSCTTTLTRVVTGRVAVRDFVKRRTVIVRAGKRYVAKRRR